MLINEFHKSLIEIYQKEELICLRDFNEKYVFKNKNLTSYFFEVISAVESNEKCIGLIEEFLFISDEILFFTGQMYFYRPFINNPLDCEYKIDNNSSLFVCEQNYPLKRYFMYADILFEKIYNFWNRIGNLIVLFLPEILQKKKEKVYFNTAIDKIPTKFQNIVEYQYLKDYRENGYKMMNKKRKNIVHNVSLDTTYKKTHIENISNKKAIEVWFDEIWNFADYFKNEIEFTVKGITSVLFFLETVNKRKKVIT